MDFLPKSKKYRIGDFAKFLGVSTTYLKHYESNGLLKVQPSESGYRYYNFQQAALVMEFLRLRNYGMSVKEMQAQFDLSPEEAMANLSAQTEALSKELVRIQSVIEEQKRLEAWFQKRLEKPVDWEVTEIEPYYFLPHSHMTDFLPDEHIYEILNEWLSWLPVTKIALHVPLNEKLQPEETSWGIAVPESMLKRYELPLNEAVIKLPFKKAFVFHFANLPEAFGSRAMITGQNPALLQLKRLGLRPTGDFLILSEMRLSSAEGKIRQRIGRSLIPIED